MLMAFGAIIAGLVLLVWSADKFVEALRRPPNIWACPRF